MITITVSGGSGSYSANFGASKRFEAVSIISPDNTPMYDFDITDEDGVSVVSAAGINAQNTKIAENFQLNGPCVVSITNAVDDGSYNIRLFER